MNTNLQLDKKLYERISNASVLVVIVAAGLGTFYPHYQAVFASLAGLAALASGGLYFANQRQVECEESNRELHIEKPMVENATVVNALEPRSQPNLAAIKHDWVSRVAAHDVAKIAGYYTKTRLLHRVIVHPVMQFHSSETSQAWPLLDVNQLLLEELIALDYQRDQDRKALAELTQQVKVAVAMAAAALGKETLNEAEMNLYRPSATKPQKEKGRRSTDWIIAGTSIH